jgi:hypothetical protein
VVAVAVSCRARTRHDCRSGSPTRGRHDPIPTACPLQPTQALFCDSECNLRTRGLQGREPGRAAQPSPTGAVRHVSLHVCARDAWPAPGVGRNAVSRRPAVASSVSRGRRRPARTVRTDQAPAAWSAGASRTRRTRRRPGRRRTPDAVPRPDSVAALPRPRTARSRPSRRRRAPGRTSRTGLSPCASDRSAPGSWPSAPTRSSCRLPPTACWCRGEMVE